MSHSYYYVIGPLISVAEEGGGRYWSKPTQAVGMIDLAKNSDFQTDVASDRNVAFMWSLTPFGSAYTPLNDSLGDLREIKTDNLMRAAWRSATGFTPQGDTLNDLLADHLTRGADPLGDDACKPLTPTIRGELEIHLPGHSRVWTEKLTPGHRHWNKYVAQIQLELLEVRKQSQSGKLIDPTTRKVNGDYHRKVADALMEKCRRVGCDDFEMIRPRGWGKDEKPLKHSTMISDDFNAADSDTMGNLLSWDEVHEDWDNLSNQAEHPATGTNQNASARVTTSLSSSDHYAQAIVVANNSSSTYQRAGVALRFHASSNVHYSVSIRKNTHVGIVHVSSNTASTGLNDTAKTISLPDTVYGSANGSTLVSKLNGADVASITNTAITGNLLTGLSVRSSFPATQASFDDFEAGDLFVVAPAAFHHLQKMMAQ
jgi:hypothetical protein